LAVPVFLLRFVRTQPLWRGPLFVLVVIALVLDFEGVFMVPWALGMVLAFATGLLFALPYVIDRVVTPRLGIMLGTLVFPLAVTTVWYVSALFNATGTWENPAC
jgi:apolipoprotein N-acyltransferase